MEKHVLVLGLILQICGLTVGFPNFAGNLNVAYDGGASTMTAELDVYVKSGETPPTGSILQIAVVGSSSPYAKTGDCSVITSPIIIVVNTATNVITSGTGTCNIVVITSGTDYEINVRVFTTIPEEDVVFPIRTFGNQINNADFGANRIQAVVPLLTVDMGGNIYSYTLTVVDPNSAHAVVTALDLGKEFVLEVTLVITNYQSAIDYGGVTVHTCSVADNSAFTGSVTFVGSGACWVDTAIFRTTAVNSGFSRTNSETGVSGTTKTYVARSEFVETSAFTDETDFYGTRSLYFRCSLSLCYDDSVATVGTCGANHCAASGRRKRSVLSNDTVVMTTVDIVRAPREDSGRPCPSTMTFQGTIVGLSAIAVVMAIPMLINVVSLRNANGKIASRRRANVDFYVATGSQVSLKASSLGGTSSSRVTSVSSHPSDRKY